MIKTVLGLTCLMGTLTCAPKPDKKLNILFLFADDQRYGTIGALGGAEVQTPHLDQLVQQGTAFTNTYIMGSQSPAVCAPSRAMLMTGRHVFHIDPQGTTIDSAHQTIGQLLLASGYHTFGTGKWHNGKPSFARSFDHGGKIMFGGMSSHYRIPIHDFQTSGEYGKPYLLEDQHSTEVYADEAIRFLDTYNSDNPFFMYVAFQAPHDPRQVPAEFWGKYDEDQLSIPPNFLPAHPFNNGEMKVRDELVTGFPRQETEIRKNLRAYYALISHLDHHVGRVISALKKRGLYENTIIIFAADNGLAVGQHGLMGKQNLYEHSIKVPMVWSGPGIKSQQISDASVYLNDIFPTLCELLGKEKPSSVDAKSFASILAGKQDVVHDATFHIYKNTQRAVRKGDWKLIRYMVNGVSTTQLFNLREDPWEIDNLAEDRRYQDTVAALNNRLAALMSAYGDEVDLEKADWGVSQHGGEWADEFRNRPAELKAMMDLTIGYEVWEK
ncbi:sulfatase-like hydrolase/transferase [Parapedobacter composti]|nr:sulfatase-like hydrolase/transferase [Parapedobacter composti]